MSINTKYQHGFTLLEVMIAFFILGVGLLGLGALSAQSVKGNQNAFYRSQAVMIAQDIADRIRANHDNAEVNYLVAGALVTDCENEDSYNGGCTSAQMASNDLRQVKDYAEAQLPAGTLEVCMDSTPNDTSCDGGGNAGLTVKVRWDGDRDGVQEMHFGMRVW